MSMERTSVVRSVDLAAPVSTVWAVVGDFQALDTWHPAVTASSAAKVGDEEFRMLTLADGARIVEHLEGRSGHAYHYAILRGPLPVAHYHATIEVDSRSGGARVTWSSNFSPTADNAEDTIAGVYDAGLNALKERFG